MDATGCPSPDLPLHLSKWSLYPVLSFNEHNIASDMGLQGGTGAHQFNHSGLPFNL